MNKPEQLKFMNVVSKELKIPTNLLHPVKDDEMIVLARWDWFRYMLERNEILDISEEDFTSYEVKLSLHCGKKFVSDEFTKCKLTQFDSHTLSLALCQNESCGEKYLCVGDMFDVLCKHKSCSLWHKTCMKYKDAYKFSLPHTDTESPRGTDSVSPIHDIKSGRFNGRKSFCVKPSTNCVDIYGSIQTCNKVYVFKPFITHSVQDALMYSPALLDSSATAKLFLVYQVLKLMEELQQNIPFFCISSLVWRDIKLDERLWVQADIFHSQNIISKWHELKQCTKHQTPSHTEADIASEQQSIDEVTDKWVCGKISNFDYLMHLNGLAGRRHGDPHHHPILPWVSNLSKFNGGWRDLSKSKYRINKGDAQLSLQYEMVQSAETEHVRHHVPDMLSDITYYVYLSRRIPQDVLQSHVRSYWEPNEYPATIQRMQEWSPDECIPEFFTDPSVFISTHGDMSDLGVPDWCSSPQDFIQKHMIMLESDVVSCHLHEWVDITFGYKLSGTQAIQSLNVCRQLVDQHKTLLNHGIVQLFQVPHPSRSTSLPYPTLMPASTVEQYTTVVNNLMNDKIKTEIGIEEVDDGDSLIIVEPVKRGDDVILLPDQFDPILPLDLMEKLLTFKLSEFKISTFSSNIHRIMEYGSQPLTDERMADIISSYNILSLFCLIVELYLAPQLHSSDSDTNFSQRFGSAVHCFQANETTLPSSIRNMLIYLLKSCTEYMLSFRDIFEKVDIDLLKQVTLVSPSVFKPIFYLDSTPVPHPTQLLCSDLHLAEFPPCFDDLHTFMQELMSLHEDEHCFDEEFPDHVLLDTLLDKLQFSVEGTHLLMPHMTFMLEKSVPFSAKFLTTIFDRISQVIGVLQTCKFLLLPVIELYNKSNLLWDSTSAGEVSHHVTDMLYDKAFLIQMCVRFGFETFLEHFPQLLIECLIKMKKKIETVIDSMEWLMMKLGPTLTSKYILRHLLHAANKCFYSVSDQVSDPHHQVVDCLMFASSMYGYPFITLQYIPHFSHMVSTAVSGIRFSHQSCAAIESSIAMLLYLAPCLDYDVLLQQLQRLSKEIILPVIGILSSKALRFPGGGRRRREICMKTIQLLQAIAKKIGRDLSQKHLTLMLQDFFSNFLFSDESMKSKQCPTEETPQEVYEISAPMEMQPEFDSITSAMEVGGASESSPLECTNSNILNLTCGPVVSQDSDVRQTNWEAISEELQETFCSETAFHAFVPLTRVMGEHHMKNVLCENYDTIWQLSSSFESCLVKHSAERPAQVNDADIDIAPEKAVMVGNQIIFGGSREANNFTDAETSQGGIVGNGQWQLKDNWLAYWGHEIGLADNDHHIHFNQIELQTFSGHSNSIRSLYTSHTEDWFMTGSKDKTVKIWSLQDRRSDSMLPSFVYRHHKKPVCGASLVESDNCVVSCDGSMHVWDPYTGQQIHNYDINEFKSSIISLTTFPTPFRTVLANTADSLKLVDLRSQTLAQEYKAGVGPSVGLIRCVCGDGNWAAVGFSSGVISVVDLRMGPILRMWQAHDNDLTIAESLTGSMFATSSLDQTIAVWDTASVTPQMVYRSIPECVHVMKPYYNELISATTSNRVSVHDLPSCSGRSGDPPTKITDRPTVTTKLRSDCLRGSISSLAVLPMKRQLLVASDSGALKLLA